jgi:hypothetical protein
MVMVGVMTAFALGVGRCHGAGGTSAPQTNASAAESQSRSFRHPGVLSSREELDFIRKQVEAGAQPWKLAFDQMKSSACASLSYTAHPIAMVGCGAYSHPDIGCGAEKQDCVAACTHALLWYLTGNEAHARKSVEIMNAWSAVLKGHELANTPLQCGWVGSVWPRGAEIIRCSYPGWLAPEIERFGAMLRSAYLPYVTNAFCHNVANWELSFIDAMTQISVFLDDQKTFDLAMAKWRAWVPACFYLSADGPQPLYPSDCGTRDLPWLIHFWFGQSKFVDGLAEETCRDLGHTQYGLAAMINAAETAHHQGVDLYGEQSRRITTAMEFHAAFLTDEPVPGWLCNGKLKKSEHPTWEIGYNHYHDRQGMDLPYTRKLIAQFRPTGTSRHGADHHMVWETLTHAAVGK